MVVSIFFLPIGTLITLQGVIRKKRKKPGTNKRTPGEKTVTRNSNLLQKKVQVFLIIKHRYKYTYTI